MAVLLSASNSAHGVSLIRMTLGATDGCRVLWSILVVIYFRALPLTAAILVRTSLILYSRCSI